MSKLNAAARVVVLAVCAWLLACQDRDSGLGQKIFGIASLTRRALIASNPVLAPAPSASPSLTGTRTVGTDIVYVSLSPGTVPTGGLATITNPRTGGTVLAAMADGGFDPVPVAAVAGDTVVVTVKLVGGGTQSLRVGVPAVSRPIVVRTNPPPRKRDVPLNKSIEVVFSEPIDPSSMGGIHLLHGGVLSLATPIAGQVSLSGDGLRATFQPSAPLEPNADYTIAVSTGIRDQTGDALEQPVTAGFTTGTLSISGSVVTNPGALLTDPFNGELRSFTMTAARYSDGSFSGDFTIFYPGPGWRAFGRVTCFAIVGNAAWIAGVVEADNVTSVIGHEYGWRAVDGTPDELSIEYALDGAGTAQDFCANEPTSLPGDGDITLIPLISGDVLAGTTAGPPPPPTMSEIAFAAWPHGGIQIITADGSVGRIVSSDSGDFAPAWSPDGATIAFRRNHGDARAGDIYLIDGDGSGLHALTQDNFDDGDPTWSPDGQSIAFTRNGRIHVMNADGSGVRPVSSTGCDSDPTWSPDGTRMAYVSCSSGSSQIYVMNADGSGATNIVPSLPGVAPSWSRDGRRIVFQGWSGSADAIYVVNPDRSGLVQLAPYGRTPAWSWDSRSIAFELYGLKVMSADGTGLHPLGNGYDPSWSPHGTLPPLLASAGSVVLSAPRDTLRVGESVTLSATVKDAGGNVMPSRLVAWKVTGASVAFDISPPGYMAAQRITAVMAGVATVSVTVDGKNDSMVIVVLP